MFKKIAITTILLATTSGVAFANAAPYVGAALGVNTLTSTSGNNYRGVPVDAFAGYGATINTNLYLGGEVFVTPFTGTLSKSNNVLRTTYGYGASVLPGIMFSDHTLGYIRAGIVRSHFTSIGENKNGGQLGVGMQTSVAQNIDLRTEYVYTAYNTVSTAKSPKSDAFKLGMVYKFE